MLFACRLLFIPYLFFVFLFPSLFTNKLRGRLGAVVYCAALRRPLFNVHELRDGAVAHPSTPFAAFSLKGLASSSSTLRVLEPAIFQSKSSVVSVFVPRTFRSVPTL